MTSNDNKEEKAGLPAAPPGTGVTSAHDYGDDFGAGFGDIGPADMMLPIFELLQSNSKACTPGTAQHVQGAQGGMFLDTIGRELHPGEPGLVFVPCWVTHSWVEWVPRKLGGGYRGRRPYCPPEKVKGARPDPERVGRLFLDESQTELVDTRYLWGLLLDSPEADHPSGIAVFPITSSKVRTFKQWLNIAAKVTDGKGRTAPPFSHRVRVRSVLRPNSKGDVPYFTTLILPVTQTKGEQATLDEAVKSQLPPTAVVDGNVVPHPVYEGAKRLHRDCSIGAMAQMLDSSLQRGAYQDDEAEGEPVAGGGPPPKAPF